MLVFLRNFSFERAAFKKIKNIFVCYLCQLIQWLSQRYLGKDKEGCLNSRLRSVTVELEAWHDCALKIEPCEMEALILRRLLLSAFLASQLFHEFNCSSKSRFGFSNSFSFTLFSNWCWISGFFSLILPITTVADKDLFFSTQVSPTILFKFLIRQFIALT